MIPAAYYRLNEGLIDFKYDNRLCDYKSSNDYLPDICKNQVPIRYTLSDPEFEIVVKNEISLAAVSTIKTFLLK